VTSVPKPTPPFEGRAGRLIAESTPRKLNATSAPEGAPHILLIMLDDVGFGSFGTFGGPVPTPGLDRIASRRCSVESVPHHRAVLTDTSSDVDWA